jgi:hypothetical protein
VSTIGATGYSYTPGELASLLGNAPASPSAAGGLAALLNPPSADGASTDGLLAALDAQSGSTGDGLTSLFGPASTVDPGIAGILDTLAQADSDADTTFDQSLPANSANTDTAAAPTSPLGNNLDITA